jgi:hypothetical protein
VNYFHERAENIAKTLNFIARTAPCSENGRKLLISHPSKLNSQHQLKNGRDLPIFVLGGLPRRRAAAGEVSSASGTFSPTLKSAWGRRLSMDTVVEIPMR